MCLELLKDKYKKYPLRIRFYNNKFSVRLSHHVDFEFTDHDYKNILKDNVGASYNKFSEKISVFTFEYKNRQYKKLEILFAILHEIRHNYQSIKAHKKWMKDDVCYISAGYEGYDKQWIERDANRFTKAFMRVHHSKISEILNVKDDWKV
jgi:hypothetical protein